MAKSRKTSTPQRIAPEPSVAAQSFTPRIIFGGVVALSLFSALLARVWKVQHVDHPKWLAEAAKTKLQETPIGASRGSIFDVKKRTLAYDEWSYDMELDNNLLKPLPVNLNYMAQTLAKVEERPWKEICSAWTAVELRDRYLNWLLGILGPVLKQTPEELLETITSRNKAIDNGKTVLAKNLNLAQHNELELFTERFKLSGLTFLESFKRINPMPQDLSHIIGWVRDGKPTNGVEFARRADLAGKPGKFVRTISETGEEVAGEGSFMSNPEPGNSLRLTLDYDLQQLMEESMKETGKGPREVYVPDLKCERSVLVLMDAKTMALRAVVCQNRDDVKGMPKFNMAFEGCWDPGSIMKVVTLSGALDTGMVTPNTLVNVYGGYYKDQDLSEAVKDDPPYYDTLSVTDILVHSNNIGAYQMARTVGMSEWGPLLSRFGFGRKTGIDSGAETPGIMPRDREWTYNSLARSAFGYNISVTPIQMCAALGALLNDGLYRPPYLVEEVLTPEGAVVRRHEQSPGQRAVSPKTARQLREMMLAVVERGSAKLAQSDDFWFGGKTATAWYGTKAPFDPTGKKSRMEYLRGNVAVSFLGYAPADDPKLIGLVVLILPKAGETELYGGKLAAPVFRRCMERALRFYEVAPQEVSHANQPHLTER